MKFILNPNININERKGDVEIDIPYYAKVVSGGHDFREILTFFSIARTKVHFLEKFNAEDDLFNFLIDNSILFPVDNAVVLAEGVCFEADVTPFDKVTLLELAKFQYRTALLGFPIEFSTQKEFSTTYGPRVIREALRKKFPHYMEREEYIADFECNRQVKFKDLHACDIGNIAHYTQYDTINEITSRVGVILTNVVNAGTIPIVVGGDHAISFFPIDFLSKYYQEIGVIQFDAHSDLYISPNPFLNKLTHANVFTHVSALPQVKNILQLGVRTISGVPAGLTMKKELKIDHISSYDMMLNNELLIDGRLQKDIPYYISVDLDVLDYSAVPEVNVPVIGGLSFYKLMSYYKFLLENYRIIGIDFVETVKGKGGFNYAAEAAARLILMTMFHFSGASETLTLTAYDYQK